MDLRERFERFVSPEPNSGCWLWTSYTQQGYGRFCINGRSHLAHRVAYELFRGGILKGMALDHLCRMKCCVNPDHLEVVTSRENTIRWTRLITHCPSGHEYSGNNLKIERAGFRRCRTCANKATARSWIKRKSNMGG